MIVQQGKDIKTEVITAIENIAADNLVALEVLNPVQRGSLYFTRYRLTVSTITLARLKEIMEALHELEASVGLVIKDNTTAELFGFVEIQVVEGGDEGGVEGTVQ